MKSRKVVVVLLMAAVALIVLVYKSGAAEVKKREIAPAKIGVVSVRKVLENSRKNSQWDKDMTAEGEKIVAQLQKLSKEIDAMKATAKDRQAYYQEISSALSTERLANYNLASERDCLKAEILRLKVMLFDLQNSKAA